MSTMTMTGAEYTAAMDRVMLAVALLAMEPLDDLLMMVERAETLGPLLEPTAYQRGGRRRLNEQRRILAAATALARAFSDIKDEHTDGAS